MEERKQERPANNKPRHRSQLLNNTQQQLAVHHSHPGPAAAVPPAHFDTSCHCLVVSPRLIKEKEDQDTLNVILGLTNHGKSVWLHVKLWLKNLDSTTITQAYVGLDKLVHLNFGSHAALGDALAKYRFLVRCGTATALTWGGNLRFGREIPHCGGRRHELPELLHIVVMRIHQPIPMHEFNKSVQDFLTTQLQLEYTDFWSQPFEDKSTTRLIRVLPRHIHFSEIKSVIETHHMRHSLWGGSVSIHAPNIPELLRCSDCHLLGHRNTSCPVFGLIGARLLFHKPQPFVVLQRLIESSGASNGYLGKSIEQRSPDHKVTLLFDPSIGEDQEKMDVVMARLTPLIGSLNAQKLLAGAFEWVYPKERHRECALCGQHNRDHACLFVNKPNQMQPPGSAPSGNGAPAATTANSNVCKSWRLTRACPRQARGERCSFDHPPNQVAERSKECWQERSRGVCNRGSLCQYTHRGPPSTVTASPPCTSDRVDRVVAKNDTALLPSVPHTAAPSRAPAARAPAAAAPAPTTPPVVHRPRASSILACTPTRTASATTPAAAAAAAASTPSAPASAKKNQASKRKVAVEDDVEAKESDPPRPAPAPAHRVAPIYFGTGRFHALSTRWADAEDDEDEDRDRRSDDEPMTPPPPIRTSSLSSLTSPSTFSTPSKKKARRAAAEEQQ
jgi:hypothetical protein